jgi:membrane protein implicated in regulation of membrane protease activity
MECGVALFSGNWWAGLLTWVAFAVVATAAVTYVAARRQPAADGPARVSGDDVRLLALRVEEIARRLESLERSTRS